MTGQVMRNLPSGRIPHLFLHLYSNQMGLKKQSPVHKLAGHKSGSMITGQTGHKSGSVITGQAGHKSGSVITGNHSIMDSFKSVHQIQRT